VRRGIWPGTRCPIKVSVKSHDWHIKSLKSPSSCDQIFPEDFEIEFVVVATKRFVSSNVHVISESGLTRQKCGQRLSMSGSKRRVRRAARAHLGSFADIQDIICINSSFLVFPLKCRSVHFLGTCVKRTDAQYQNLTFSAGETLVFRKSPLRSSSL